MRMLRATMRAIFMVALVIGALIYEGIDYAKR